MRRHAERKLLYDYLKGELDPGEEGRVEQHLAGCRSCSAFARELRRILPSLEGDPPPDLQRPEDYWDRFPAEVSARILSQRRPPRAVSHFQDALNVLARPRSFAMALAGFILVVTGYVLWQRLAMVETQRPPLPSTRLSAEAAGTAPRMDRYLQRSKILLVGINNLPENQQPVDLSAERAASRELANEARELRQLPMDPRAARLVADLESIQKRVANMNPASPGPELALVRHGIRKQNLLFKVRMAEALYRPGVFPSGPR